MLIDWLQFTIHNCDIDSNTTYGSVADFVLEYLPYSISQFIITNTPEASQLLYLSIGGAINLYKKSFSYINGVRVCFDGVSSTMGINVIISGSVLRNCNINSEDIKLWWERFRDNPDVSISRVDIAYDTITLDFPVFFQSYLLKEFIAKPHKNSVCLNSNQRGTIYFGSRGSRVHIRIYDKRQEQLDKNYHDKKKLSDLLTVLPDVWTRVEFQFRQEICSFVLDRFVEDDFSAYANGFLRFVDIPEHCSNISRDSNIKSWWSDLLGSDNIDILYYRKESSFNYEAFVKNVVPQIKAILSVNPEIYKKALSEGSVSNRTLDNLQKDEILGNNYF